MEYTGDLAERFRLATDSEYWVAVYFKSCEDKEKFLRNAGLLAISDKYMDGYAVARVLGLEMDDEQGKTSTTAATSMS
ncbi:hypothetical protein [Saccharopolyspora sp. NPDC050642]|uniref:hypothetical protein n=1 Tax=Saccharopolyspora sp. NPDC050642 TaxID=3157099 RepID=UPI00340BD518